jgi:hypothetical protein
MRVLVRMAATEGNYEAMLDAHALAMRLLPPGEPGSVSEPLEIREPGQRPSGFKRLADARRSESAQACNHRLEAGSSGHDANDGFVETLR